MESNVPCFRVQSPASPPALFLRYDPLTRRLEDTATSSPVADSPPPAEGALRRIGQIAVLVRDADRAVGFYRDTRCAIRG